MSIWSVLSAGKVIAGLKRNVRLRIVKAISEQCENLFLARYIQDLFRSYHSALRFP
ncbi:MAG: hypothetical protein ACE5JD_07290 [Candidatus Methylomirabilia bacterium]